MDNPLISNFLIQKRGYEITIQKTTRVHFLGFHGARDAAPLPLQPRNVDFRTIPTGGPIGKKFFWKITPLLLFDVYTTFNTFSVIEGFLKTEFVSSVGRNGVSSYGIGAISDGQFKLTIQITNFVNCSITKTTPVRVQGEVHVRNGNFLKNFEYLYIYTLHRYLQFSHFDTFTVISIYHYITIIICAAKLQQFYID